MHKTLTATAIVALLGVASAANAADIYTPGYKDGPVVAYSTWTGYYIGGHIGGAWSTADFSDINHVISPNDISFNADATGLVGGGQIGYAYQLGNLVIGPEVDIGGMDLSHSTTEVGGGLGAVSRVTSGYYFDITGRAGYTWGPTLLYIKGGYAYYDGSQTVSDNTPSSYTHGGLSGWTGGGGVEYLINPAWSLKAEYLYFEFNTNQITTPDSYLWNDRFTAQSFKVGFNYHFCGAYQPLK